MLNTRQVRNAHLVSSNILNKRQDRHCNQTLQQSLKLLQISVAGTIAPCRPKANIASLDMPLSVTQTRWLQAPSTATYGRLAYAYDRQTRDSHSPRRQNWRRLTTAWCMLLSQLLCSPFSRRQPASPQSIRVAYMTATSLSRPRNEWPESLLGGLLLTAMTATLRCSAYIAAGRSAEGLGTLIAGNAQRTTRRSICDCRRHASSAHWTVTVLINDALSNDDTD